MYLEGTAVCWVLFLLGFLSCGLLSLTAWLVFHALTAREALKMLEDLLKERDQE